MSGRKKKKSEKTVQADLAYIQATDPRIWTVSDVAKWLDFIELGQYKKDFIENSISGEELLDLQNADLVDLGITLLGHRKKIFKKVTLLARSSADAFHAGSEHGSTGGSLSQSSDTSWTSSKSGKSNKSSKKRSAQKRSNKVTVKCKYQHDWTVFKVKKSIKYSQFKRKIRREYGADMDFKYKDEDGDEIRIKKRSHWKVAISEAGDGPLRLYCSPAKRKERAKIGTAEQATLLGLLDPVCVADDKGTILLFNKAAEKLFGWTNAEVVSENVKMLMPPDVGESHDFYLWRYSRDKKPRVIGQGRKVIAMHKNGHTFPVHLSVTAGEGTFTAVFKDIRKDQNDDAVKAQFGLLQNMLMCAIVIDTSGKIVLFNRAAEKLLGYKQDEVVGKDVAMLMPEPYCNEHSEYLSRYIQTDDSKIMGTGRDVVAKNKDGSIIPVNLSLTEQGDGDNRFFTGILAQVETKRIGKKNMLDQERDVLANLLVPAIIIDDRGIVQVFNSAAQKLFGYGITEVLGKNVKMLMPSPDKEKHDRYIRRYLKTGKAHVIGVGRDVVALHKDGTMLPVRLSVTEKTADDGTKFFTGLTQEI